MLCKYLYDPFHIKYQEVNDDLAYKEIPVAILNRQSEEIMVKRNCFGESGMAQSWK